VYPLRGETLDAGSTRGVSNVFADANASVALERGVLLAVRPGEAK
jgi:thiamine pyrophosphokinase